MRFADWFRGPVAADDDRCWIVAEAGVNHNGDPELALEMVDLAADVGADAVKFQTFDTSKLARVSAPAAAYQRETEGVTTQAELLSPLELDRSAHESLKDRCDNMGLEFLSTPFDPASADFLEELGVKVFKVGSGDVTNVPLLRRVAASKAPIILSTGMSWLAEVEHAVRTLEEAGCTDLVLLHCTSDYPANLPDVNLRAMDALSVFGYPVGYSDHTVGSHVAVAAVARGARVLEKHFTLDRNLPGPDHEASLTPQELERMIDEVRGLQHALGDGRKRPMPGEEDARRTIRRGLVAAQDIPAGHVMKPEDLAVKRPAEGALPPLFLDEIVGREARRKLNADEPLDWFVFQ